MRLLMRAAPSSSGHRSAATVSQCTPGLAGPDHDGGQLGARRAESQQLVARAELRSAARCDVEHERRAAGPQPGERRVVVGDAVGLLERLGCTARGARRPARAAPRPTTGRRRRTGRSRAPRRRRRRPGRAGRAAPAPRPTSISALARISGLGASSAPRVAVSSAWFGSPERQLGGGHGPLDELEHDRVGHLGAEHVDRFLGVGAAPARAATGARAGRAGAPPAWPGPRRAGRAVRAASASVPGLARSTRRASSTWPRRAAISLSPSGTSGHRPARLSGSISENRSSARSRVSVAWVELAAVDHDQPGDQRGVGLVDGRALDHGDGVGLVGLGDRVGVGAAVEQVDHDPERGQLGRGGLGDRQVGGRVPPLGRRRRCRPPRTRGGRAAAGPAPCPRGRRRRVNSSSAPLGQRRGSARPDRGDGARWWPPAGRRRGSPVRSSAGQLVAERRRGPRCRWP